MCIKYQILCHRIKEISSFEMEGFHVLVTASSDGFIKMWSLELGKVRILDLVKALLEEKKN